MAVMIPPFYSNHIIREKEKMNYAELIEKADECTRIAISYFQKKDFVMVNFWKNASIGFKQRAENLKLSQGAK